MPYFTAPVIFLFQKRDKLFPDFIALVDILEVGSVNTGLNFLFFQAVPYSRDYEAKYRSFRRSLPRPRPHVGPQVELHVNRKDVMETSFRAIMSVKDVEVLKTR